VDLDLAVLRRRSQACYIIIIIVADPGVSPVLPSAGKSYHIKRHACRGRPIRLAVRKNDDEFSWRLQQRSIAKARWRT